MSHKDINIKEALNEKQGFHVWWRMLRPHTLTASFVPVFIGTMFAYIHDQTFHVFLFLAMMFAALLIQAATNMFNEYYDFTRGLDKAESVGIGGTIVRDGISPQMVLNLAFTFFGIAVLIGIYISIASSWWIAVIGALSMAVGYFYTGGPYPIAYTPFGEVAAGFLMGMVMIGISYFIQVGHINLDIVLVSIPTTIFIGAIMMSNNIRDRENDQVSGRHTVAILLGHTKAVGLLAIAFALAFLITCVLIMLGILPIWSIITLLSVKLAVDVIKGFVGKNEPLEMMPAMVATGKLNTIYGILLGISLIIGHSF